MELRIEIEPGSDPIEGVVHREGAPSERFVGWMGLVELIVAAADDHLPDSSSGDADDH